MRRNLNHLWDLFEPVVEGMGYELVEIEYDGRGRWDLSDLEATR